MLQDDELQTLMQSAAEKSLELIAGFSKNPENLPAFIQQYIEFIENIQSITLLFMKHPQDWFQMQFNYMQDAVTLMQNQFQHWIEGQATPIEDKRFKQAYWMENPFFNLLSQQYLLAAEHLNRLLEKLEDEDPAVLKKLRFFINQYLDALSPSNYLYSNPVLMAETIESRGKNLLKGLNNLLSDMQNGANRLVIKMTDMDAFTIGENIATAPGKVIYRNDIMELIQYLPQTKKVKALPLLIIPPWINKYYILDLSPHNSLVRWLTAQGITVFMISWRNPGSDFAEKSLYDYMQEGPQTAIKIIKEQCGVKQLNSLGFCIGGTLQSCMLAYHKAHQDKSIKSATFLASMIDFSDPGDISVYIDEKQIKKIENDMQSQGYLAGHFLASTFNSLRANDLVWSFFVKNYIQGKDPAPFDVLYWNADVTNMPQTMMSQYLRWMYLNNQLIQPGSVHFDKTPLEIQKIDTPVFFVSTIKDHIAPWQSVYQGYKAFSGPKQFVLGGSGHIVGIVNPPDAKKYNYYTNNAMPDSAEQWLESAKSHPGSWWPEWLRWLKARSGKAVDAADLSSLKHPGIMDAPGTYVREKSLSDADKK